MKLSRFWISLVMCVALFGCGPGKRPGVVLVLLKTLDNPFFQEMQKGASETWRSRNGESIARLDVRSGENESDVTAQRRILETYIQELASGPDQIGLRGVLLTPSSSGPELLGAIATLNRLGVPVVVLDTRFDVTALARAGASYDVFIGSSNFAGGELAADLLAAKTEPGARLLLLNGVDGQETAAARREGFVKRIASLQEPGKAQRLVVERTADWRRRDAQVAMEAFIADGQRFDGVFAANDEMALGVLEAHRQHASVALPPVVGFDATKDAVAAVNAGTLYGTIAQDPYGMASEGVKSLLGLLAGEIVARETIVPVKAIVKK